MKNITGTSRAYPRLEPRDADCATKFKKRTLTNLCNERPIGLILFGSGIALLSYVLEVFGEHTLGWHTILGLLGLGAGLKLAATH